MKKREDGREAEEEEEGEEEEEKNEGKVRSVHVGELLGAGRRKGRREEGGGGGGRGRSATYGNSTTRYHSLAESLGGHGKLPWEQRKRASSVGMPVLPMTILHSSPLTTPTVNC